MAQEHLDRPDIDARFEEVGRKTMAERMDAVAVRNSRTLLRMIVDFLGRADGPWREGIEARKQPRGWPGEWPVGAPCGHKAGGKPRGALRAPFALLDTEPPARTCHGCNCGTGGTDALSAAPTLLRMDRL